jgi:hypothetical protein
MTPQKRPQLLGFWMCVALVVGNSIGSGVLWALLGLESATIPATKFAAISGFGALNGWILFGAPLYFLVRNDRRRLA